MPVAETPELPGASKDKSDLRDEHNMLPKLQGAAGFGFVLVILYSLQFYGTWQIARIAAVGIVIGGAALLLGFLLGFVFCYPRAAKRLTESSSDPNSVEDNSNLADISDWLTKIIVGVGLVELSKIPHAIWLLAGALTPGLRPTGSDAYFESSRTFCLGLLLFLSTVGFLIGYIWTRLSMQPAIERLRREARATKFDLAASDKRENAADQMRAALEKARDQSSASDTGSAAPKAVAKPGLAAPDPKASLEAGLQDIESSLALNPHNGRSWFEKARILKRLALPDATAPNQALLNEALRCVTEAVRLLPGHAAPLYNMACYMALLGKSPSEILPFLEAAIKIESTLKIEAETDSDLKSLRDDPQFKTLMESAP
ncbi:MAG TPA: hypothetical protein VFC39_02085 [Acidobacteriaceae bacterium]|nr:hypothetical protein [Acidobacteriaceae bacterium]